MPIVKGDVASLVIDVEAVDNYSDVLAQINKNTATMAANMTKVSDNTATAAKKSTSAWTEFRSMYSTVLDVVRVGQQVWSATVDKAQEYDQTIKDVMLSTGATAEASSRLVQVVDDAGVSYGTLKTAMKNASKDGIEPNIASLQMLSDQYLKLAPGVERNQFLLDKFGKSGLEMARVMELGGAALGKMNAEIDGGLVLTQEAIDQSEEYRKNVDNLTDSWDAFAVSVGNKVIPVLNDVMEGLNNTNEIRERANGLLKDGIAHNREEALTLAATSIKIEEYTQGLDSAGVSYRAMAEAATSSMDEVAQSAEVFSMSYEKQLDLVADFTQSLSTQSEKLDEIKEKYGEGSQEYADATAQFEIDGRRRMLSLMEQQLAMDGLDAHDTEILLRKGLEWGVYSQTAVDEMRKAQAELAAFTEAVNTLPSGRTFTMSVLVQGADAVGGLGAGFGASQWEQPRQHAAGGSFMIPMAYGNEGFRMGNGDTASGGEMVTISPRGQGNGSAEIVAAIERNRVNEDRIVQLFETAIQRILK